MSNIEFFSFVVFNSLHYLSAFFIIECECSNCRRNTFCACKLFFRVISASKILSACIVWKLNNFKEHFINTAGKY